MHRLNHWFGSSTQCTLTPFRDGAVTASLPHHKLSRRRLSLFVPSQNLSGQNLYGQNLYGQSMLVATAQRQQTANTILKRCMRQGLP